MNGLPQFYMFNTTLLAFFLVAGLALAKLPSGGSIYEHLHMVSPGDGVSAHRLRLIQCFSTQGSSLGAGPGAGGRMHGR